MIKRIQVVLLAAMMIINLFYGICTAVGSAERDTVVSLQIDNPMMKVNGKNEEIDVGKGTKPLIRDGRTLVPIRAIVEAFGGTVGWDPNTQTVTLNLKDNTILLSIGSKRATLNQTVHTLDVAPAIIHSRTMLPIRFIAEGFHLGVAWDAETRTVTIIRQVYDSSDVPSGIPAYSGESFVAVNNNVPMFEDYEIISGSFEYYSELDTLERCGVCVSSVSAETMPTEDRESISSVKPSGWQSVTYDSVDGKYLYNRCHLIGFQLTGENANEENLITGTRYLNVEGMLPFENQIAEYIETTGNSVMYRVTPVFVQNNLIASGVLLEGYSIEDNGDGISFCVYCYNVQPGITINYADGTSSDGTKDENKVTVTTFVLNTNTKKFHVQSCSSVKSIKSENYVTSNETPQALITQGFSPCGICNPK